MFNYYNIRDVILRIGVVFFSLEKRMFKRKRQQIVSYKVKNAELYQVKCLLIGDSHTYGLNDYLKREPNVVNIGINGDTTQGVLNRYEENISTIRPDIVVIQIGYNDFKYRTVDQTFKRYKEILSLLVSDQVYIFSLFPVNYNRSIINKKIIRFNRNLESLCSDSIKYKYVNVFSALYDKNIKGITPGYTYDGVHLNKIGYSFFLKYLEPIINSDNIT